MGEGKRADARGSRFGAASLGLVTTVPAIGGFFNDSIGGVFNDPNGTNADLWRTILHAL